MKIVLWSTYTINELNPPGSFLKHCNFLRDSSESLNQIKDFIQLNIISDGVSVWCTGICHSLTRNEREKNRQKEKVNKIFLFSSLPSLQTDLPYTGQICIQLRFISADHLKVLTCTAGSRSITGMRTRMAQDTEHACTSFLKMWNLLCSYSSHWCAQFNTSPAIVIHILDCVLVLTIYRYILRVMPLCVSIENWDLELTFFGIKTPFSSSPQHIVKLY